MNAEEAGIIPSYEATDGRIISASSDLIQRALQALGEDGASGPAILDPVFVWRTGSSEFQKASVPVSLAAAFERPYVALIGLEDGHSFIPDGQRYSHTEQIAGKFVHHLTLAVALPPGYHSLTLIPERPDLQIQRATIIICPPRAYDNPALATGTRALGVQLYALRSKQNGGHGDFMDLSELAVYAAGAGYHLVGLNPLHALPWQETQLKSPYAPSSRYYMNPAYLRLQALPEWQLAPGNWPEVAGPESRMDHVSLFRKKNAELRRLYALFEAQHLPAGSALAREFEAYCQAEGDLLEKQATYDALCETFAGQGKHSWQAWPAASRHPDLQAVQEFKARSTSLIGFYKWLYFHADRQLKHAAGVLERNSLSMYLDLAVGVPHASFETWAFPECFALKASIGAPPDEFAPQGQDWGLAPFHPGALRAQAYRPFIEIIRRNMPAGGVLRIDHVMQLMRLYWVLSPGATEPGLYVRYPAFDLAGILALESHRHKTMIVGEDLGTVPPAMRHLMSQSGFLSWKVFYFEKRGQDFKPAAEYPASALFSLNTHDLPVFIGYMQGRDLHIRHDLSIYSDETLQKALQNRIQEILALLALLECELAEKAPAGFLQIKEKLAHALKQEGLAVFSSEEGHAFISSCFKAILAWSEQLPCRLRVDSLHDLLGESEQPNLPGTTVEYPNWALRYSRSVGEPGGN